MAGDLKQAIDVILQKLTCRNIYYWIDRRNGVGGFWAEQLFPFADPTSVGGFLDTQSAVYAALPAGAAA